MKTRLCKKCNKPLSIPRHKKRKKYCFSCEVAVKKDQKKSRHDKRVTMNGFTGEDYWALYEAQNKHCAVYKCRANGRTKFLAVEHDHKCNQGHDPKQWCRSCVRGLTCSMHNGWLGKAGDDPLVFLSLFDYLVKPPAREILNGPR
jgi:Recombination endonuclease VII